MKAPRLKKYGEVVRLLGGFGKLKVTRTYTRLDDNGNSSDKVIDSYLLVKGIDGNSLISVDSVPYLDLCVDGSVIRAKDMLKIFGLTNVETNISKIQTFNLTTNDSK